MAEKCEKCGRKLKNQTYRVCFGCKHQIFAEMERDGYLGPPTTGELAKLQDRVDMARAIKASLRRK